MGLPKTVLLAITDYYGPFYLDGTKTGVYFSEIWHPLRIFLKNGFTVQIVSENGKYGLDDHSVEPPAITDEELKEVLDNKISEFNKHLDAIKPVSDVDPKDYSIFYAAGGHGTTHDFDRGKAPGLDQAAEDIYQHGGLVTAVCHGPMIFGQLKDKDGNYLVKGKKVTGFPEKAEQTMQLMDTLEKNNARLVEEPLKQAGANWQEPPEPLGPYVVQDGRIISGANPASAGPLAEKIVEVFEKL